MKQLRFTIKRKITIGFLLLILIFSISAVYSVITINRGVSIIRESLEVVNPSIDRTNDFILLVNRSKMLITNWVYLQTNNDDKEALKNLHAYEYPELKDQMLQLLPKLNTSSDQSSKVDTIFMRFEELLDIEKEIMDELVKFEDYEDPIKKFTAEETISEEVLPRSARLISRLEDFKNTTAETKESTELMMMNNFQNLIQTTIVLSIILLIAGISIAVYISGSIVRPLKYLKENIDQIGQGELVQVDTGKLSNDELGDMAKSVANMASGYSGIGTFAKNIGDGKYESEFKPLSEKDVLGNALLEMRDNLKAVADEDKKRNWSTSGMAKFGDILRLYSNDYAKLADEIISNLVKYLGANQGALFVVSENNDGGDPYMELAACYAWNKKKYSEKRIYRGEGLSGQAWIEGSTIFLTEVPDDYVSITSGLGEANPRSVAIVPLKVNEEIHGVIEIASFSVFQDFEIEFIEKISESIASTFSTVKVNERTQTLLKESTMLTEQMRAQEEEMRQNMEELQATQEKIQRDQNDRESREAILKKAALIFELSPSFQIRNVSEKSRTLLNLSRAELDGKYLKDFVGSATVLTEIKEKATETEVWSGSIELKQRSGKTVSMIGAAGQIPDSIHEGNMYVLYLMEATEAQ
ncbi:MAG: GAF domain-containing protein [Cyclobacteriaceae bacterium]